MRWAALVIELSDGRPAVADGCDQVDCPILPSPGSELAQDTILGYLSKTGPRHCQ